MTSIRPFGGRCKWLFLRDSEESVDGGARDADEFPDPHGGDFAGIDGIIKCVAANAKDFGGLRHGVGFTINVAFHCRSFLPLWGVV